MTGARVATDASAAAQALLAGHLVALPTETVYGLAARADDPDAVARIYAVKGRPASHPLIVHVADADAALAVGTLGAWVSAVPPYAAALAEACWPGPLTLVLPRSARALDAVTGAQDTVALRVPGHPLALATLRAMDQAQPAGAPHGIAAPSANRFGRVSPTSAAHVLHELGPDLDPEDVILDGGESDVGVESTIVDCTGPAPRILRPGGVTAARVQEVTGLAVDEGERESDIRVPGSLASHYAPRARVRIARDLRAALTTASLSGLAAHAIGLLAPDSVPTPDGCVRLASPATSADYARVLYAALRSADEKDLRLVLAVPPAEDADGLAAAVLDRLTRAAAG